MQGKQAVVLGLITVMATGCAGQRHAQEHNQLKSDVGLLDQRIGQLERTSLKSSSQAASPMEAMGEPSGTAATAGVSSTGTMLKPSKKEIQQALKNAGFYQGAVDGKIGPQTREAITQFQQVNGLKVDGVVGKQTWAKLAPYLDLKAEHSGELSAAESLK